MLIKVMNKYGIVDGKLMENDIYKVKDLVEKPKVEEDLPTWLS